MAKEKEGLEDHVKQPFSKWMDYIGPNHRKYYVQLFKILLTQMLFSWGIFILLSLLGFGAYLAFGGIITGVAALGAAKLGWVFWALVAVLVLVLILVINWIQRAIGLTAVVFTDAEFRKRPFGILKAFGRIKWKVLRFVLLDTVIQLVIYLPVFALVALIILGFSAPGSGIIMLGTIFALIIALILFFIFHIIISVVYGFAVQFWKYGFLVENLGVVESLNKSLSIVKNRFAEVLVFDIVWVILIAVASIPLFIYNFAAYFVLRLLQIVTSLGIAGWVIYLAAFAISSIITLILTALVQVFSLPTHYLFWDKVKKREI